MDKERFSKVLQSSLLLFDNMPEIEVKRIISDGGAVEIAKLINKFIVSYDNKKKLDNNEPKETGTGEKKNSELSILF